jgi:hypothetical protein
MSNFEIIEHKLHRFIRKFYVNQLLRGVILFVAIGLFYFLVTAAIEHFLWLNTAGRKLLFWMFIAVQLGLFIKFIVIPLARLTRLFSGIDFRDASMIIGQHFPEVSDKLVNVLQLHRSGGDDELTWASINQKSEELKPIPFTLAINLSHNRKYLKYLAIPVIIIGVLLATGNNDVLTSANRVVDYSGDYKPPAPFTFQVMNGNLSTLQNSPYSLQVQVTGTKLPENVSIVIGEQEYFLTQLSPTRYTFEFERPVEDVPFYLIANQVRSKDYRLQVQPVPVISSFQMQLDYPAYTGKRDEVVRGTGNALVPQGTRVSWKVNATDTDLVQLRTAQKNENFDVVDGGFAFAKAISSKLPYSIVTSNTNVRDYEQLDFAIDVVVDEFPELKLEMKKDSVQEQVMYFQGQAADDYGIRSIQMIYYPMDNAQDKSYIAIPHNGSSYQQFLSTFPGNAQLKPGKQYAMYFQVTDNDAVHNYKTIKSRVFTLEKPTLSQEEQQQLANQKESLSNLEKRIKEQSTQQENLKQLSQEQLEKQSRSFSDKKKLEQALENQQRKEQQIRQDLKKIDAQMQRSQLDQDPKKEKLQERIQQTIEDSKKNEELLKQLEEYQDKISKEELQDQLQKANKNTKEQQRSLEQLLELTKRYYVTQKYEQLGRKLKDLAARQLEQSRKKGEANTAEDQEQLSQEYKQWEKELRELERENEELIQDMDLDFYPEDTEEIKENQQGAKEDLKNDKTPEAQSKQKEAARQMAKQAAKMQQDMQDREQEAAEEDAEMLRQILDNLIVFSQGQEDLLNETKQMKIGSPAFGKNLRSQKELEQAFRHVDDSLFTLSSRNPDLGKEINEEVLDIYYYLEQSLEELGELDLRKGRSSQQSTLQGSNQLAVILSDLLDDLNAPSIPGKGKPKPGQGSGFQLPDIMKQQESLKKKAGEGKQGEGKKGKQPGQGSPGSSGKPGEQGEQGSQGKNGKKGSSGSNGQSGQGNLPGSSGQPGTQGNGTGQSGESNNQGSSGSGNGNGSSQENGNGSGSGTQQSYTESEQESKRLYEIYKEQQQLRNALEDMIINEGLQGKVDEITDQMKAVERKLLDQGFNREVENQMTEIMHDLLKLKGARFEQGEQQERQSQTNRNQYVNPVKQLDSVIDRYFNNQEILNRQVLPLQPQYRGKVKEYFKTNDRVPQSD